jgi:transcriptional regulator with XRE-family HTH domain
VKKRSFSLIGQIRKSLKLDLKQLAQQAAITPQSLSTLEKKRAEPDGSTALRLALALGLRIDDILNLYSGLPRLLTEQRPLFRLPHTIQAPEIVKLLAELNQPAVLKTEYYSIILGAQDNRISTLLDLTQRLAQIEKTTAEYQTYQRAEFVPLAQPLPPGLELPAKLELGQAYQTLLELQKLTTAEVCIKTSFSKYFLAELLHNRAEVSVVEWDLASWTVGLTVDELLFVAYPRLARFKWPFFIQALPGLQPYQEQQMLNILISLTTLEAFEQSRLEERARLMLAYKSWWQSEAQARKALAGRSRWSLWPG